MTEGYRSQKNFKYSFFTFIDEKDNLNHIVNKSCIVLCFIKVE